MNASATRYSDLFALPSCSTDSPPAGVGIIGEIDSHLRRHIPNHRLAADQTGTLDNGNHKIMARMALSADSEAFPFRCRVLRKIVCCFADQPLASQTSTTRWEKFLLPRQGQQERYSERLAELLEIAQDEGISPLSHNSKQDFFQFLAARGFPTRKASLALLDGGALGAVWRNEQWRLSLRFDGDGKFSYVLLDRTNPPEGATGISDLESFNLNFEELDLKALIIE